MGIYSDYWSGASLRQPKPQGGVSMADPFTYQMLMGQMGKGGQVIDKGLFRLFPQTAARAAGTGIPGGPMSSAAFTRGAAGVARLGSRRIPVLAGGIQA